jgi:hypothetical protein
VEIHPTVLAYDGTNLLDGLNDSSLVIHRHYGNKRGVGADRSFKFSEIEDTVLLDSKVGNVEALLLQLSTRVEYTLVFLIGEIISQLVRKVILHPTYGLGGDNVAFFLLMEPSNTLDRHIIGFCRARSENDVFGVSANEIGNALLTENRRVGFPRRIKYVLGRPF